MRSSVALFGLLAAAACGGDAGQRIAGPAGSPATGASYPGFDIAVYPGDGTMQAWLAPATPYRWVGFYLAAPCHRDVSYHGKLAVLTGMGWGTAAVYVGQQTWEGLPDLGTVESPSFAVSCSRTLLSSAQGALEAADAVAKATDEGFPAGSAIFLDVEYMSTVTQPMLDYLGGWINAVLADGRFRPAVYCAAANAAALYAAAAEVYGAAKQSGGPDFWIASTAGFTLQRRPAEVGYAFARVWQGVLDKPRTWSGITLTVDEDVASTPSPSAAPTLAAR